MNQNFFDDMAKMAGGAFQGADVFRKQMETTIKEKLGDCAKSWNLVTEEQMVDLRTMIVALEARVAALEAAATPPTKSKTTDVA
jgi:BMFP domain-containing protein YqiC